MSKHTFPRCAFAATVLILGSALTLSAYADVPARTNAFAGVLAVKDPSHYGPHLPAADAPSRYTAPVPGSTAAILAYKDPSRFGQHLAAADTRQASASFAAFESVKTSRPAPRPGSGEAIILAKDPMYFKRGMASVTSHN